MVAMVAQGLRLLGNYSYAGQMVAGEKAPTGIVAGVHPPSIGARASQALTIVVVSWQLVTQASTGVLAIDEDRCMYDHMFTSVMTLLIQTNCMLSRSILPLILSALIYIVYGTICVHSRRMTKVVRSGKYRFGL